RWAAVEALARAGIFTGILLMPMLPWITDAWENIESIVARAADAGARFVYPGFGVTLRMNQKAYFYQEVDKRYPGMARRYAEVYGPESHCICPDAESLWKRFEEACQTKGLLYRMEDIVAESRQPYCQEQIRMDEW
nr:radical SAM protein [Clostridia bacterium]